MDAGLMWRDVVQSKRVPLAALVIALVAFGFRAVDCAASGLVGTVVR